MRRISLFSWIFATLIGVAAVTAGAEEAAEQGAAEQEPVLTRAPELLEEVPPLYPPEAIEAGIEGDVVIQITIGVEGTITDAKVIEGPGHGLDEAGLEAALQLRFTPAEVDGEIRAIAIHYTFLFRLAAVIQASDHEPTGEFAGVVVEQSSGEPLQGVFVSISEQDRQTKTGSDGAFELTQIRTGALTVVMFKEGYHRRVEHIELGPGERIEVESTLAVLDEDPNVTVVRGRTPWRQVERAPLASTPSTVTSHYSMTRRDIDFTPGGMEDLVQAVGRQPGVAGDELYGQFWIRGGDSDETVFYLDRVALYNPFRLAGFTSSFNPELLDQADIFLAAAPAVYRDSLSGIVDARYIEGTPGRWDGTIDLSTMTAKFILSGAIGPQKQSTFVFGARRTYLEPIFAVMRALGAIGDMYLTPTFGDVFGRYVMRPGPRTRVRFSALYTDDLIHFEESPEDEDPLFQVSGKIRMKNRMFVASSDVFYDAPGGGSLAVTGSFVTDHSTFEQRAAFELENENTFRRLGGRADGRVPLGPDHFLRFGTDLGGVELGTEGEVVDERWVPTWAALPAANYGADLISIDPRLVFFDGAVYVEDDWQNIVGNLDARFGVRWTFANPTGQQLFSPRLGLAYSFPTMTTIKLAGGLYHQSPLDPLLLDSTYGNPDIGAERNLHLVLAVDQLLPFGALIRVEGYYKYMDQLVVNPDNRGDLERGITYTNDGTGWSAGVDTAFMVRTGRIGALAQYSLMFTRRTNPLNRVHPQTYAPPQDQRHTALVGANVAIGKKRNFIITVSYQFHTGRPVTPVSYAPNSAGDGWLFEMGDVNSERYGNFHEINVRNEIFHQGKKVKFTAYVEVLNVANFKSDFWYIWGDGGIAEDGSLIEPRRETFTHLPIRPWFGLRLEF